MAFQLSGIVERQLPLPPPLPSSMSAASLALHDLGKSYGENQVLRGVSLTVEPGEFVAVIGRSGCGKSTLLRLLSGLELPTEGSIHIDGVPLEGRNATGRMMFQDARLLPWKRVWENVSLGLSGAPTRERRDRAQAALEQVGLPDRGADWPSILSGGQKQRVALARALVTKPPLLLLDEPLGALDALTRLEMQGLVERVWREHGMTAILVTHDVEEAVMLCDRIILLSEGDVVMDLSVPLPRPRRRGTAEFAELAEYVLSRVLATK